MNRNGDWISFPSFGVPLWVDDDGKAFVAPGAEDEDGNKVLVGGMLNGFEKVHLVRAAKVYVNDKNELVLQTYTDHSKFSVTPDPSEVLARNISAVWFQFNKKFRTLRMVVAGRGVNVDPDYATTDPITNLGWPSGVTPTDAHGNNINIIDGKHRLMIREMTWRIRN